MENVQGTVQELAIGGPHTSAKTQGKPSWTTQTLKSCFQWELVELATASLMETGFQPADCFGVGGWGQFPGETVYLSAKKMDIVNRIEYICIVSIWYSKLSIIRVTSHNSIVNMIILAILFPIIGMKWCMKINKTTAGSFTFIVIFAYSVKPWP